MWHMAGVGFAELFALSLRFEAFAPGAMDAVEAAVDAAAADDDDGVPRPPSAMLLDAAAEGEEEEEEIMTDADASDGGFELNATQLGRAVNDLCAWV
jgi:hypothetical protein